jgi:hypothetical protein
MSQSSIHTPILPFAVVVLAGLHIVNISNPSNPIHVGYCYTPGTPRGVAVSGLYAYVADDGNGLRIIDISDPSNPTEVGFYDTDGWAISAAISGAYAYVADQYDGIRVIDVSNTSNPTEVGFYDNAGSWPWDWAVAVSGRYIFNARFDAGFEIYENLLVHWTDDPLALAYNGNHHLVRKPNSEELHLVYTDQNKVIYRYSSNGGANWTLPEVIGDGSFPAIVLDSNGLPSITRVDAQLTLYYRRKLPESGWSDTIILYDFIGANRPLSPSITITHHPDAKDTVHVLVSIRRLLPLSYAISEVSLPIQSLPPLIYRTLDITMDFGPSLNFPSITKDHQNTLHAVWQRGDTICYATRQIGQTWNNWGPRSGDQGLQSAHPFVETYGDMVYVVWQKEEDFTGYEEIYKGWRQIPYDFSWTNFSRIPNTP